MSKFILVQDESDYQKVLINCDNIDSVCQLNKNGKCEIMMGNNSLHTVELFDEVTMMIQGKPKKFDFDKPTCGNCSNQTFSQTRNMITCTCCSWSKLKNK